jgi:hypothetical protein
MKQNRFAQSAFTRGAADGQPPPSLDPGAAGPAVAEDPFAFATEAEETAYWQGVADGIRNGGGTVPPRLAARAAGQQLLVPAHGEEPPAPAPDPAGDLLDFSPTQLRRRHDGWTPKKQREFVEALADTGIVRAAAEKVGMTEQSANRLRRRADARGFDRACAAALQMGARRIVSVAYERAIEGTIKRHYFHGELKAEERVHDNRLLIALLNKLPPETFAPTADTRQVADNWEPWMDAVEQGLDAPPGPEPEPFQAEIWEERDGWVTNLPPPANFQGYQEGEPGEPCYGRELTPAEQLYWDETGLDESREHCEQGMWFYRLDRDTFFPWGPEPFETSAEAAPPEEEPDDTNGTPAERQRGPDFGLSPPADEPGRRRDLSDAAVAAAATSGAARSAAGEGSGAGSGPA